MKKPVSDALLLMLGLTILLGIALDGSRTRKSAGKQLSYPSYKSNKPKPKDSLVPSKIENRNDGPHELRLKKRLSTAWANNPLDDADRLVAGAEAAQRLINYADENPDGDELKDAPDESEDATDDSQDDAGESEGIAGDSADTSDDSEDDAADCVE